MKILWGLLFFLVWGGFWGVRPSAALGDSCVEIFTRYDDQIHTVIDLETGSARSYIVPPLRGTPVDFPSPDGRYIASAHPDHAGNIMLTLTDTTTGQTSAVAEQVEQQILWSRDSSQFAYIQTDAERSERNAYELVVVHAASGERTTAIIEGTSFEPPHFAWSADGSKIATVGVNSEGAYAQILSAPSLDVIDALTVGVNNPNITWSPSGQSIVFASNGSEVVLYSLETGTLLTLPPADDGFLPRIEFSPDELFILTYYPYSDFNAEFNIYNLSGEIVWSGFVATIDDGFTPIYDWVDVHQLFVSAWTELGINDGVLIDPASGESRVIHEGILGWALSPDGRKLALMPYTMGRYPTEIRNLYIYDLTRLDSVMPLLVTVEREPVDYVWSADSAELLVLNQDRTLEGYTYATGVWREAGSASEGDVVKRIPCAPPQLAAQTCTLFGGFATEQSRWFFDLGDGTQIPVQMPASRPSLQSGDGQYTLSSETMPKELGSYTLSLHDSLTGETREIADHVNSNQAVWAPISDRFAFLQISSSDVQIDGYTLNFMSPNSETPSTIHLPADESDLRLINAGVAWSPDESMIAVAYGYQPTQVKIFAVYDQREIVSFEVQEGQTELLWSPTGKYLTAINPIGSLDTISLYLVEPSPYATPAAVITIQTGYRSHQRLSWSPDESYLVEYGTHSDFDAEMSIFGTDGKQLIDNLLLTSVDDGGNALYGWLDNRTLIAGLDYSRSNALSQVDVLTRETQPLEGAALNVIPCGA